MSICNVIPPCEEASLENSNKLFSMGPGNSYQESACWGEYKEMNTKIYVCKTKLWENAVVNS